MSVRYCGSAYLLLERLTVFEVRCSMWACILMRLNTDLCAHRASSVCSHGGVMKHLVVETNLFLLVFLLEQTPFFDLYQPPAKGD